MKLAATLVLMLLPAMARAVTTPESKLDNPDTVTRRCLTVGCPASSTGFTPTSEPRPTFPQGHYIPPAQEYVPPPLANADLGGIASFLVTIATSARGGTGVSLDRTVHGVLYVPFPKVHSADGKRTYAVFGLGADLSRGVSGTAMHGAPLALPMLDVGGVMSLMTDTPWAKAHLSFTDMGDLTLGAGILPLPVAGAHGKWVLGSQVEAVASVRFAAL